MKCYFCGLAALTLSALVAMDVRADTLGMYGDASISGSSYQLTSSKTVGTGIGWAGLYDTVSGVLTPSTLTQLSADYQMTIGTFGAGAPRFSISDSSGNEAYIYFGTPTGAGTFTDPATGSTGNYADLSSTDVRVENNGFGGLHSVYPGLTWADFVSSVPNVQIKRVYLDLDGYYSQPGGTQQMLVSRFTVNDTVFSPSVVPLPSAAWAGLSLLGGLGTVGGIKRVRRSAAC